jgi:hypothetical protein
MSVEPDALDNQERDLTLVNRENAKLPKRQNREDPAALALKELRERVAKAKATDKPKDPLPHCGDCYRRGWAAAVAVIEGMPPS